MGTIADIKISATVPIIFNHISLKNSSIDVLNTNVNKIRSSVELENTEKIIIRNHSDSLIFDAPFYDGSDFTLRAQFDSSAVRFWKIFKNGEIIKIWEK